MYDMTLTGFINLCNSWYSKNEAEWMIVEIQIGDSAPEIIINPKENFEAKIEYYKNAYHEDLTLKANPNIKIVRYDLVHSLTNALT